MIYIHGATGSVEVLGLEADFILAISRSWMKSWVGALLLGTMLSLDEKKCGVFAEG